LSSLVQKMQLLACVQNVRL